MTTGEKIAALRREHKLSQEALGEKLGLSRQAVSKWESDGGVPELDTLIAMSRLFHVTIGQLLGVEELRKSGVGSGEDGGQTQVGTGLHEAQVEAILRRYVEATRAQRQAPPSMYGKYGWKAPLLAVAGLAALMGHRAATICTIIAQRIAQDVNTDYKPFVRKMIETALDKLAILE